MKKERLDKILAERTELSRNTAKTLCKRGHFSVDGKKVFDASTKVSPDADIRLNDEPVLPLPLFVMYHKPCGIQSTMKDEWGRPCLAEVLPPKWQGKLHPVGRLDADTSGLLMFCKDGSLTQKLLHPRHEMEREYIATVEHTINSDELTQKLTDGVQTSEGIVKAQVVSIEDKTIQLIVKEGKYRMVRKILANAGYPVETLHRVRYGNFLLDELPEGELKALAPEDSSWLTA